VKRPAAAGLRRRRTRPRAPHSSCPISRRPGAAPETGGPSLVVGRTARRGAEGRRTPPRRGSRVPAVEDPLWPRFRKSHARLGLRHIDRQAVRRSESYPRGRPPTLDEAHSCGLRRSVSARLNTTITIRFESLPCFRIQPDDIARGRMAWSPRQTAWRTGIRTRLPQSDRRPWANIVLSARSGSTLE
jgi:hypothetical protein